MVKKTTLLGNHQKCWLWGRNAVTETLHSGKWPIVELYLADCLDLEERTRWESRAEELGIACFVVSKDVLQRKCNRADHQGYLAKMGEYPYTPAMDILRSQSPTPLYTLLDCIHDAYNFGAVIRSAEVFSLDAVFIGTDNQVGVTSHVARSSSGAVNRIAISRVGDLSALSQRLKEAGIVLVGASEKADTPIDAYDFTQPTTIVMGNEGVGIGAAMQAQCDCLLQIPQHGAIGSLNAAAAASIFFYEARRQRSRDQTNRR